MTAAQVADFLAVPRHAIVATQRADGTAQLTPVWYLYDGTTCYFAFDQGGAKCRNLRRDPRVSVCVDAGHPDARAVMLYGQVSLRSIDDSDADGALHERIVRRYLDTEDAVSGYLAQFARGQILALLTPQRILTQDYNPGPSTE